MKTRLLLPFTHGVDLSALEFAAQLAQRCNATLVPLALIATPTGKAGPRIDYIQQSQDFLTATAYKAARHSVVTELHKVYTDDSVGSISAYARIRMCIFILLCERNGQSLLLSATEVSELLVKEPHKLVIAHLPCRENLRLPGRFLRFLSDLRAPASEQPDVKLTRPPIPWCELPEVEEWTPIIAQAPLTRKGGDPLTVRDVELVERSEVY